MIRYEAGVEAESQGFRLSAQRFIDRPGRAGNDFLHEPQQLLNIGRIDRGQGRVWVEVVHGEVSDDEPSKIDGTIRRAA